MSASRKSKSIIEDLQGLGRLDLHQICSPDVPPREPLNSWVCLGDELSTEEVLSIAIDNEVEHVIDKNSPYVELELQSAAIMDFHHNAFATRPISCLLKPSNSTPLAEKEMTLMRSPFNAAIEKAPLLMALEKQIADIVKSRSLQADVLTVADELITNAVYNAPYVSKDNRKSGISRIQPHVTMGTGKTGEFFAGSDNQRLVVGVIDPFGTLNVEALLRRIRNCYVKSVAATMDMEGHGGAGIGCLYDF